MSLILGCDPGATGAFVLLDTWSSTILACIDNGDWCVTPDAARTLRDILRKSAAPTLVALESQHSRPARDPISGRALQGIASTFKYAEHYGIIRGCVAVYDVAVHRCDPGVWKASMGLSSSKGESLEMARRLWPASKELFKRKRDDGRAEAALLCWYGRRFLPLPPRREL